MRFSPILAREIRLIRTFANPARGVQRVLGMRHGSGAPPSVTKVTGLSPVPPGPQAS